jgi:hypothetical protein
VAKVESLKSELDRIKDDLLKINRSYQKEFINSFYNDIQFENDYKQFINEASKSLQSVRIKQDILRRNLYTCQDYLNKLKSFYDNKVVDITFKPSEKLSNLKTVGIIPGCKIANILTHHLRSLDLGLESCNGMVMSNGILTITSFDENKLVSAYDVFNTKQKIFKEERNFESFKFNGPFGICIDSSGNLFICDSLNDRIVVTDNKMKSIVNIFGKTGNMPGEFDSPCDICFYKGHVYVLDGSNKRIQEFSIDGVYRREIKLHKRGLEEYSNQFQRLLLINPVRFEINHDTIAVIDNFKELYTYNHDGKIMQVIENIRDLCFLDNHLFTCSSDGLLKCYDKTIEKDSGKVYYSVLYKRLVDSLKTPISFMKSFSGHLLFSLNGKQKNLMIL